MHAGNCDCNFSEARPAGGRGKKPEQRAQESLFRCNTSPREQPVSPMYPERPRPPRVATEPVCH